jgi:hypothetical protein
MLTFSRRCAACQVCGGGGEGSAAEGEKLRCCKCLKASHKDCLQPSQRETLVDDENAGDDESWVSKWSSLNIEEYTLLRR